MTLKTNLNRYVVLAASSLLLLNACALTEQKQPIQPYISDELKPAADTQAPKAKMTDALEQELLSNVGGELFEPNEMAVKRFDVSANEVGIRAFFASLVDDTPYSVAIHPEVQGAITLSLKDVTLDEVTKVITRMYSLDVFREGKVVQVMPARLRTESIPVNYLMMKRNGTSNVSVVAGGVSQFDQGGGQSGSGGNFQNSLNNQNSNSLGGNMNNNRQQLNGASIQTSTETDYWRDLEKALQTLIGTDKDSYVIISPQSSLVTVTALPSKIAAVKDFLFKAQDSLQRQVILEAKIIEVSLNDEYQRGVNWSEVLGHIGSTDFTFGTSFGSAINNAITTDLGGVSSLTIKNKDFNGVISLLETQGDVQMLSNPRVTATNNQKAVIKVGQDEYFVTEVSSTTVTGNATTTSPEIELTPFFSGIALDVTPQIDEFGSVILHVHPSVTETDEQKKVITLNNEEYVLPLAQSNIRESDTVIRADSGEIVVIGGLMQTVTTDEESKTPILGDVPILGNAFKSVRKRQEKKELVILIKPTVVMANTWQQQQMRTRELLNSWYSTQ